MNKLLLTLLLFFLLACGNREKSMETSSTVATSKSVSDRIEVLYFHGAQRCITCRAIQKNTEEVLDSLFVNERKQGKIVYKVIDISKKENAAIADKYQITWSSLLVNTNMKGHETIENLTDFAFANARSNPKMFKDSIENKLKLMLKKL